MTTRKYFPIDEAYFRKSKLPMVSTRNSLTQKAPPRPDDLAGASSALLNWVTSMEKPIFPTKPTNNRLVNIVSKMNLP